LACVAEIAPNCGGSDENLNENLYKDANGSSSSSSENFVAEKDGKFVIPVPGPCK
jgi:hypothetical protein